MKLPTEFIQLPLRFDASRMAEEVAQFPEQAWRPHPQGYPGNSALPLISAYGDVANNETKGPMRPTAYLERSPYLRQVLASFDTVVGRTRLMRIDGNAEATRHVDTNYYWLQRLRVHVPIVTDPDVRFLCGEKSLHMAAGETWVFDTWRLHNVINPNPTRRIHLVIDTTGSRALWDLLDRSSDDPRFVPYEPDAAVELRTETVNQPVVMSPAEQQLLFALFRESVPDRENGASLVRLLTRFTRDWQALWSLHGDRASGWPSFAALRDEIQSAIAPMEGSLSMANGMDAVRTIRQMFLEPALNPDLANAPVMPARATPANPQQIASPEASAAAFKSVFTSSFPALLHGIGASLVVTTYQSGRVVLVRAENAQSLNTHLRMLESPMGVAATPHYLAIGTKNQVLRYWNQRELAPRIDPPGKHDACFVLRDVHVTGDIRIHEVAFVQGELWVVNTRFSSLCTLDAAHSFVPRWRPPFVTHLAPQDRCHLNGMAVVEDRVRYVTALGETNTDHGWRDGKTTGGIVIDVDRGATVLSGLCMPHSPRWHDGRLWFLESGKGTLAVADPAAGTYETVAQLPGFTRGLTFAGPYAIVGLSQVRESNIFGGLPLAERVPKRECGVWVVDTRTGQIVGFLRFEGIVQEIFDVQFLPGLRYPELLEPSSPLVNTSWVIPTEALAELA